MTRFFYALTFLIFSVTGTAQSTEDSVKTTINNLFHAMKTGDTVLMQSVFASGAVLQTIGAGKEGETVVNTDKISQFISSVGKLPKDAADERIRFDAIKTDGALAMAWTPYEFYYNGKFSHCGVNSFQLVRLAGGWKIQYIIDTRRKQNCL